MSIKKFTKCSGCHACYSICPKKCINMVRDEEGFLYPEVVEEKCINCGLCEKICPILNLRSADKKIEDISAYAMINNDEEVRLKSSSGGVFTLLANYVIERGGVVFGVGYDDSFNVVHKMADNKDAICEFRGSKYVQSVIGDTYNLAKENLEEGKLVLFTGTSCQIGGLYAFLNKDYENLITQDIVCHGVPSSLVWKKYVDYRTSLAKANISNISFRNKENGWKRYLITFKYDNGTKYCSPIYQDPFMRLFLDGYSLRPSCYECSYKGKIRQSDITLADFWGVNNVAPEMDDDKGTSLVFINSKKGENIFNEIKSNIKFMPVDIDDAIKYNVSTIKSSTPAKNREQFFVDLHSLGFDKIAKKYCRTKKSSIVRNVLSKIKRKIWRRK